MNQEILPLSCIQCESGSICERSLLWESGSPTTGMVPPDLNIRVNDHGWLYSERDLAIADVEEGPRVEYGLGEVREGPRVECGVGAKPEAFSLDPQ